MATIDLGKIKMVWRGAYNNTTAYTPDDVVSSGGNSYICILASTGNAVSNTTYWNLLAQGGTDVGATLTTQGDILYRDGSGIQRLAAGTNGQALITGGAGANPSWGSVSSGFVKISSGGSSTDVSTFTLDNLDVSTYSAFKLIWHSVPSYDGGHLRGRIRTGGASGADFTDTSYRSAQLQVTGGSGSISTAYESNQNYWEFLGNAGNNSYEGHFLTADFYPRKSTMEDGHGNSFTGLGIRTDEGSNFRHISVTGHIRNQNTKYMTGLKLFYHSGDISQYDYELWGMK